MDKKALRWRKAGIALACALVLSLGAFCVGCAGPNGSDAASSDSGSSAASASAESSSGMRTVTDAAGNKVEVPAVIKSIVVPFPAATQTVLGLGAADLLTGCYILPTDMNEKMFGSYIDSTTLIRPSDLNAEVVMNCDPDFCVLASQSQADALADLDVPVLMYSASTIQDLEKVTDSLADAINTDEARAKAKYYTDFTEALVADVKALCDGIPEEDKPVVYVITEDDPLSTHGMNGTVNDWVRLSGGKYVPEVLGVEGGEITLTAEQILEASPDIIVCVTTAGRDALLADPAFATLPAVQNGRVYVNPMGGSVWFKGHFESPLQLSWAPTIISPEQAANLDTRKYVEDFFKNIYGYDITDTDYELIMNPPVGSR